MSYRFPVFLIVLITGLALTGWGLFGNEFAVYDKPDPRDEGPELSVETLAVVKELEFTDMVSRERVSRDAFGHLIDNLQEAPCFS